MITQPGGRAQGLRGLRGDAVWRAVGRRVGSRSQHIPAVRRGQVKLGALDGSRIGHLVLQ